MSSAVSPNPLNARAERHPDYYIAGGDVVFRVENSLFRVHRYFFTRDSSFFLDKLPHPPPPGEFSKGSSDNNPFVLEDTLKVDFESLLWVFYNEKYSIYEATVEEWASILKLAHKWNFIEVKAFALRELERLEIPALDKIILYHTHDVDRRLLQAAYSALTVRDESITIEEGQLLGLETSLRLAHAREIARAPVVSGKRPGAVRSSINIADSDLDMVIKRLFNLGLSDANYAITERPSTPQTPTGRGTPMGGRNTPRLDIRLDTQTNGTGSPATNPARGRSMMNAYPSFSSWANLPVQGLQMASTVTQMEPPMAARAADKGAGRAAGAPNGPESKGKEAAAAEVVSDGHQPEPAATQSRTGIAETKKASEAQGAPSVSKSEKGQGSARKGETAEQSSSTARPERARAQSEQLAAVTPAEDVRSERSRSRTAEPTKKEQMEFNTTVSKPEPRKRDTTPTPTTREPAPSSHRPVHHHKGKAASTSTPAATATTTSSSGSGLFGFMSGWMGNSGDPGYESSSRESEDDAPMVGAWRSRDTKARQERQERERAEAEARERARAQEATRLRLEAEAVVRVEAEKAREAEAAKARADAEKAREEAEAAKAREEAEAAKAREEAEKARKEAEVAKAREEAEKARKEAEATKAREEAEKARKEAEAVKAREEAEKEREEAEEKERKEAEEKNRKADEVAAAKKAKKAAKAKTTKAASKAAEEKARQEAEEAKAKADAEKAKLEVEAKAKADAEKAKLEAEAKVKADAEKAKLEAEAKAKADAEKAKREAEAKADTEKAEREAEVEAEKEKAKVEAEAQAKAETERAEREAEAKAKEAEAEKAKLEAEAKSKEAETRKAELEAEIKAKLEAEAKAEKAEDVSSKPEHEAETQAKAEGKTEENVETNATPDSETKRKAEEEAEARAKAEVEANEKAKALADAEAKKKAEQGTTIQASLTKEKERRRLETERLAKLREKEADEKIAKTRAADKAARMAHANSPTPTSPARSSGGGWFNLSKLSGVAEAVASVIASPADEPKSPSKPIGTGNSDPWRRGRRVSTSSPGSSPVSRPSTAIHPRGPTSSLSATSSTAIGSSSSVMSSTPTLVSQEPSRFKDKQEGPASSLPMTLGTIVGSPPGVVFSTPTLVSQGVSPSKAKQEGAIGEEQRSLTQTASTTAVAPPAGQVAGNEDKNQPADSTTNKQPTHEAVEAIQATNSAVPDASGDKSTSISNEVDTAPTHDTTPAKAVPKPELGKDPASLPLPPDADAPDTAPTHDITPAKAVLKPELDKDPASLPLPPDADAPPPVPEKNATVTNKPTPTSETSTSPSQMLAPTKAENTNETDEPPAPPTKPEAPVPVTENVDSKKGDAVEEGPKPQSGANSTEPDAVEEGPKPQSGADGGGSAANEQSTVQDGDGKADDVTKLTLRLDRVRELSTTSIMSASSSTPGTPAEEAVSSAVDEDESGAPEQVGTSSKAKKKNKKKNKKNRGEKNSPHPPSGKPVSNADDLIVQETKPPVIATTTLVDILGGEGEGELVEKEPSGEEDAPVMVDKVDSSGEDSAVIVENPQTRAEAEKTAEDTGSDEWGWQ